MAITQSVDECESKMPGELAGCGDSGDPALVHPSIGRSLGRSFGPEKCRDLMTKDPFCCVPEDTAAQAARLMKRHNVGALPVVEDRVGRKLIGVVTDRDLALRVVARALEPSEIAVKLCMSTPVIRCSPDDACGTAPDLMERHRIRRVFVTDRLGRLVGVIAEGDIALRLCDPEKTGEVVACVSQPDPPRI
jgi:CBS domain-containing protein